MARENVIIQDGQWFSWIELDRQHIVTDHKFSLFEVGCVSDGTFDDEVYRTGESVYIAGTVNIDGLFNMADAIMAANEASGHGNCHMVIKLH